jgi:hypothetical protein
MCQGDAAVPEESGYRNVRRSATAEWSIRAYSSALLSAVMKPVNGNRPVNWHWTKPLRGRAED